MLAEVLVGGADISSLIREPDGRAPRVLVCDPYTVTRTRLYRVLASAGCRVEAVADAVALAGAARNAPDLIVADASLFAESGAAMLAELRVDRAASWLPIILIGTEPGDGPRRAAIESGADDYLARPFGARDLLSRVGLQLAMARVGREASEAIRGSERRLAEVLAAIGDAVYAMDRDMRVLFANRMALQLWCKKADEVIGHDLPSIFPGVEAAETYQAFRHVMETGKPLHLETESTMLWNRWVALDVHPAPHGGVVVAFRDIDERKRADARLRQSEERFRLMVEALPEIAFVIRPDGYAEHYNGQLRVYAGGPVGPELAARLALHPLEDRTRVERAGAAAFAAGDEFTVEARMRRYDGAYRWHRIHHRPIRLDGKIAFWLGTAVDIDDMREANALLERRVAERTAELEAANRRLAAQIDERERAEAQLRQAQRIEAIGKLTSGIAHDFNNLLTAIIGNLELLQPRLQPDNERAARLLGAAMSAAERGSRLTTQLLAFSRQQRMRPEATDLNRIVANIGGLLQSTIGAAVGVETILAADLLPALADASQIELVLLNLAINARDSMPAGGTIVIETGNVTLGLPSTPEAPGPGDYAMVSVADCGTGIAPDILDKVFDPFFTTKEVGKGSGLGLSQVLGVAQQLGGGVRIKTQVGKGTIVKVYLPHASHRIIADRRLDGSTPDSGFHGNASEGGRILLVDDDGDVRAVAAAMLAHAGYDVIEAGSGGAALEWLDHEDDPINLLIADIVMPGMSGVELAHAVRLNRPELPILFVTGFAGAALPEGAASPGELLRKPFRAAELAAKVAAMLSDTAPNDAGCALSF
ncbi:MAG TPA: response regulator [Stellaceae bacterium]|nr:response regulator [Stellaceae bacterium]